MTILDYYFNNRAGMGSFESTICKAWVLAASDNRRRLENAFPEHFPVAQMYGVADFREFANRQQFDQHILPYLVKMNQWGKMVTAVHLPWSEIKKREHLPATSFNREPFQWHERAFGTFIDPATGKEVECLCFADYTWSDNILWYVTEEKLEDIIKQ